MIKKYYTTDEKAKKHEYLSPFLNSMYQEFKDLAKKNPDAVISKGKIKIANRLLEKLCTIFEGKSYSDLLDLLDENDLPQASDVALILSQYQSAMEQFKEEHYGWSNSESDNIWYVK
ncbi:hypothetical protein [Acinetobacter beijerinckii]|uniref:hypothetical protein n=1 Tax=Acinetobacter beijerinckii TaxID=262668 RepID=UPI002405EF52|nr:hypothetical protein [Acinetobacter beijerinckii]